MNKNKKMHLIGISGKAGVGKDTVAAIIQYLIWKNKVEKGEKINLHYTFKDFTNSKFEGNTLSNWEIKKFADKLKDIVCLLIGCTREQLEDREFKEKELEEEWWYWKLERDGGYSTILLPYNESTGTEDYTLTKLTPRLLLQLLGTQCGRQIIHPNIWVNALMGGYKKEYLRTPTFSEFSNTRLYRMPEWIISDVRFPNETEAIKNRDGIIIKVERFTSIKNDLVYFKNDASDSPINGIYRILEVKKDNCTLIDDKTGYSFGAWFEELSKIKEHESETALDKYNDWDYIIENNGTIDELIIKVKKILSNEKII